MTTPGYLTLSELTGMLRAEIEQWSARTGSVFVLAEISEIRRTPTGHWFLRLVERDDSGVVAEMPAVIWARQAGIIEAFRRETGAMPAAGMKMHLNGRVGFHERYGLRFDVYGIDATYALGEMQRRRREVIERLTREGLMDRNKALRMSPVPQRIAIVSSEGAAGYGDFVNQLEGNPYGYRFKLWLSPALMQGDAAEASIAAALDKVGKLADRFDAVALIRGGGSQVDLSCFDSYGVSAAIARCPLPVISGLGHERDETVADMAAHTRTKTPTAAAEAIIAHVRAYEERIEELWTSASSRSAALIADESARHTLVSSRFGRASNESLVRARSGLDRWVLRLAGDVMGALRASEDALARCAGTLWRSGVAGVADVRARVAMLSERMVLHTRSRVTSETVRIESLDRALQHLDPVRILQRGFSITRFQGRALTSSHDLLLGDELETRLARGIVLSRVYEVGGSGEER
jgi:exodeoxyribonuclease VII large subunit